MCALPVDPLNTHTHWPLGDAMWPEEMPLAANIKAAVSLTLVTPKGLCPAWPGLDSCALHVTSIYFYLYVASKQLQVLSLHILGS